MQLGWADVAYGGGAEMGDGVGDGPHSWSYGECGAFCDMFYTSDLNALLTSATKVECCVLELSLTCRWLATVQVARRICSLGCTLGSWRRCRSVSHYYTFDHLLGNHLSSFRAYAYP